jgi:hypothetical protein
MFKLQIKKLAKIENIAKFSNLTKFNKYTSKPNVLYIPRKSLIFIDHRRHGTVYPVYIADEDFNKKNNPKKIAPLVTFFSSVNLFLIFTGFGILPVTNLYTLLYINELTFLSSIIINYYLLHKYFKYLSSYTNRVKSLYLLPSGDKIIIETFDGTVKKLENLDIYEFNTRNKFHDIKNKVINWSQLLTTNDNNFKCVIKWGRASENFIQGKSKIMDYEIFSQIVGRFNIETKIKQFKKEMPLGFYSNEEKRKIMKFMLGRIRKRRIERNRLSYYFKILRRDWNSKKNLRVRSKDGNSKGRKNNIFNKKENLKLY